MYKVVTDPKISEDWLVVGVKAPTHDQCNAMMVAA